MARLLAEHGPALPMPDLRRIIAADCPRMLAGHVHDVCGVHFPGLIGLDHFARAGHSDCYQKPRSLRRLISR